MQKVSDWSGRRGRFYSQEFWIDLALLWAEKSIREKGN